MIIIKKSLLVVLILTIFTNCYALNIEKSSKIKVSLYSCVDGDTAKFKYQNEVIKVRFLAIDTPELEHEEQKEEPLAMEARNYTCNELKKAQNIYLEFDNKSDTQDKYGRYLAWVFVNNDLLQEKIIKNGYAKVAYLYDDYKYTNRLKKAEIIAQKKKNGLWHDYKNDNLVIYITIISILLFLLLLNLFIKKM